MSAILTLDDMDSVEDIQAMIDDLSDESDDGGRIENAKENKNGYDEGLFQDDGDDEISFKIPHHSNEGKQKQYNSVESGDNDKDSDSVACNSSQGSSKTNNTVDVPKFDKVAQSPDMTNEKEEKNIDISKDSPIKNDTKACYLKIIKIPTHVMENVMAQSQDMTNEKVDNNMEISKEEQESKTPKHDLEDVVKKDTGAPPTKKLKVDNIEAIRKDQDELLNQKEDNENVGSEKEFLDNLKALNGSEFMPDLVIVSEEVKFACHKIVLASRSDVLKDILALGTHEKDDHLKITEVSSEIVKHFLNHIYTGEIPKEIDEIASELYQLALKYNMKALTKACENSLLAKITDENVLDFLVSVDKNKSSIHIKEYVLQYIASNADKIMAMKKFQMISKELMIEIMRCLAYQNKAILTAMKNGTPVCDLNLTIANDHQAGKETDELIKNKEKWQSIKNQEEYEKDVKGLYGLSYLSDIVLICGVEKFLCHKVVLASRSDAFKQIIESESFNGQWEMNETSPDVLKLLVKHIYAGEIPKNIDNVATELYLLAAKYKMKFLSKACENSMMSKINNENALKILVAVDKDNSAISAKKEVVKYISSNYGEIMGNQKLMPFSIEQPELMIEILQEFSAVKNKK